MLRALMASFSGASNNSRAAWRSIRTIRPYVPPRTAENRMAATPPAARAIRHRWLGLNFMRFAEHVPGATHGLDQLWIELAAKVIDVNVDHVGAAIALVVPNR